MENLPTWFKSWQAKVGVLVFFLVLAVVIYQAIEDREARPYPESHIVARPSDPLSQPRNEVPPASNPVLGTDGAQTVHFPKFQKREVEGFTIDLRFGFPSGLMRQGSAPRIVIQPVTFSQEYAEELSGSSLTVDELTTKLIGLKANEAKPELINVTGEISEPDVWTGSVEIGPEVSAFRIYYFVLWKNMAYAPRGMNCHSEGAECIGLSQNSAFVVPQAKFCTVTANCWPQTTLTVSVREGGRELAGKNYRLYLSRGSQAPFPVDTRMLASGSGESSERVEVLRNIEPSEEWKIWVVSAGWEGGKDSSSLSSAFAFTKTVEALTVGERRHAQIDLPRLPAIRVVVPHEELFIGSDWSIEANYVEPDGSGGYKYKLGARGYSHKAGMATWCYESTYLPSLENLVKRASAEGVRAVVGYIEYSGFIDWLEQNNLDSSFSGVLKLFFKGEHWDPLIVYKRVDIDLLRHESSDLVLSPTRCTRTFSVQLLDAVTKEPIANAVVGARDYAGHSSGWATSRSTNDMGLVRFDSVPNSAVLISVKLAGYRTAIRRLDLTRQVDATPLVSMSLYASHADSLVLNIHNAAVASATQIWAMVVSRFPDPAREMHQTWDAIVEKINPDGTMRFTEIPPADYLIVVFAAGMRPWTKMLSVSAHKSEAHHLEVVLEPIALQKSTLELSSVKSAVAVPGGMNLGFKRQFALIQGDFHDFASRIINILRGEIIWKRNESGEAAPYPSPPLRLFGDDPGVNLSVEIDPSLPAWLVGPSGAIIPLIRSGESLVPNAVELGTIRGSIEGTVNLKGLVVRAVPVPEFSPESAPYNLLSGMSVQVDEVGNFLISHILPGTYRLLLLSSGLEGGAGSATTVLNQASNTIVRLGKREDQTVSLKADNK